MGKLVDTFIKWYVDGYVLEMNQEWDVDYMYYMLLEDMIKKQGYTNVRCMWYWNPKFSFARGLRPLNYDGDML